MFQKTQEELEQSHHSSVYTIGVEEQERTQWLLCNPAPRPDVVAWDSVDSTDDCDLASFDAGRMRANIGIGRLLDFIEELGELDDGEKHSNSDD